MKRIATIIATAVAVFGVAGAAATTASAENATSDVKITGQGTLYKDALAPVDASFTATVLPDPGQTKLRELNNVKFTLSKDFTFDPSATKVCTNDVGQKNEESANAPTAAVIAKCPDSVVGEGTAVINIAGFVSPGARVTDPILTVFNGGKDSSGSPQLFIQGYSATVVPGGHGIFMKAVLKNGVMDVKVPQLAANSSVTTFTINIPGKSGLAKDFAQSKCSTGSLGGTAALTLGTFDENTGTYSDVSTITSNSTETPCVGKSAPAGKFKVKAVKGAKKVKKGQKKTYKVKVKNVGKSTIKGVKVKASGKGASGKGSGGSIRAGQTKTIKVKVKFKKKGTSKVKFKVTGKKAKTSAKKYKVKVK